MRRYLVFLPSLFTGILGGLWLLFRPLELEGSSILTIILIAALLVTVLLGGAKLLEKNLTSFRYASKLMERTLINIPISLPLAFLLAVLSSVSEELFFRGALMSLIGVWGQALVFGLMHPLPRKGWSYMVFTFVAGLCFGYAVVYTGSLWSSILAHFIINLQGFLEVRKLQLKRQVMIQPR